MPGVCVRLRACWRWLLYGLLRGEGIAVASTMICNSMTRVRGGHVKRWHSSYARRAMYCELLLALPKTGWGGAGLEAPGLVQAVMSLASASNTKSCICQTRCIGTHLVFRGRLGRWDLLVALIARRVAFWNVVVCLRSWLICFRIRSASACGAGWLCTFGAPSQTHGRS